LAGKYHSEGNPHRCGNGKRKKSNPDMLYGLGKYFTPSFYKKSIQIAYEMHFFPEKDFFYTKQFQNVIKLMRFRANPA
jgi:hypothetical protein